MILINWFADVCWEAVEDQGPDRRRSLLEVDPVTCGRARGSGGMVRPPLCAVCVCVGVGVLLQSCNVGAVTRACGAAPAWRRAPLVCKPNCDHLSRTLNTLTVQPSPASYAQSPSPSPLPPPLSPFLS